MEVSVRIALVVSPTQKSVPYATGDLGYGTIAHLARSVAPVSFKRGR